MLFIPFLGITHLFDWDEINFAECAREMLVTHNYTTVQINFQPFWEKPPLFIWLSAASMKLFGISEFATRLPDAICGIITLMVIFNTGSRLYDRRMGLIWTLCYAGSILPQFYFKTGIIDPWFNLFIFLGISSFIRFSSQPASGPKLKPLLLSALYIGLAVLTKGPVAFLVIGLCMIVYWAARRFRAFITIRQLMLYVLVTAAVGGIWFLLLLITGQGNVIAAFFRYQVRLFMTADAGHGGPFYFHFIVLLLGCFPASAFAISGFRRNTADTPYQKHFKTWMLILFWVVLLLFSIVRTKIIHYSSLCYFPFTFLAAYSIHHLLNGALKWKKRTGFLLFLTGGIIALALTALPLLLLFKEKIIASGIIRDAFFIENLQADVHWSGWESLIGLALLLIVTAGVVSAAKRNYRAAVIILFSGNLLITQLMLIVLPNKIEQYTQGAAVAFYQSLQGKECYVETFYKSYASYFYSRKQPLNPNSGNIDWLLRGPIDRPAYFVSKSTGEEEVKRVYPELQEIGKKNGYVFFLRNPAFAAYRHTQRAAN